MPALDHLRSERRPPCRSLQKVWRPRLPCLPPNLPNFPDTKNAAAGGGTTKGHMTEIEQFVNSGLSAQRAVDALTRPVRKKINPPSEAENQAALADMMERQRRVQAMRRDACLAAMPALDRLAVVMQGRSGQPYKVRSLLYSLWNGKPASLVEIVSLDWEIRQDLLSVCLAFGYEGKSLSFFYDAIETAITKAGQWEWFLEEYQNVQLLVEYIAAAKEGK